MLPGRTLDVSVVLPFRDDEDLVGIAVQQLAAYLQAQPLAFELLAVDQDSGDNSHAVLALVRSRDATLDRALTILHTPDRARDRGYAHGVQYARGRVLWLLDPAVAIGSLEPFAQAHAQVIRGELDVVVRPEGFSVAHRIRSRPALDGLAGTGPGFHRRLARHARARGLAVTTEPVPGTATRVWQRLAAVLSP
jgi:hypothetical protein